MWPEFLDVSDGYEIQDNNGYYSRTLGQAWSDAEDRFDPTDAK